MKTDLREKIRHIIFEADDPPSKLFDVILLWAILVSVIIAMLDSVESIANNYHDLMLYLEWIFTIAFSIEYVLRIWTTKKPIKYITSVYGIIDLLAVIPTYLSLFVAGTHYFMVVRTLRLLRIFRILRLFSFVKEAQLLILAIRRSRDKLIVFSLFILALDMIIGTLMYMIEGPENGFTSIPIGIYWAIVTMTTVGYGDIHPHTVTGQFLSSIVMLLGYTFIAVPTGIVSVELSRKKDDFTTRTCPSCSREGHDSDAVYCKHCGQPMINSDQLRAEEDKDS